MAALNGSLARPKRRKKKHASREKEQEICSGTRDGGEAIERERVIDPGAKDRRADRRTDKGITGEGESLWESMQTQGVREGERWPRAHQRPPKKPGSAGNANYTRCHLTEESKYCALFIRRAKYLQNLVIGGRCDTFAV